MYSLYVVLDDSLSCSFRCLKIWQLNVEKQAVSTCFVILSRAAVG